MAGAGSGSPCGACKFLRRKCVRGCVFAPYFCHDQGAAHFAAIHKVFGASNASKLLMHLPVSDRPEAALTISYEAQARLQDPIYGCVAHIFALQQQIVNLEAQLATLKAQAAQGSNYGMEESYFPARPQASVSDHMSMNPGDVVCHGDINGLLNSNSFLSSQRYPPQHSYSCSMNDAGEFYFAAGDTDTSSCAMASLDQQSNARRSTYHDLEDLQSVAFGHLVN